MEIERSVLGRRWRLRPCDEAHALAISQLHGVPEIVGRVLAGRGVRPAEAAAFLAPKLRHFLPEPSHLLDLDRAAERLADAVLRGEKVGLIGDYDVDGATATALAARYLRSLGVEVAFAIPDRLLEGYGPNPRVIEELAARGCRLVVTLDTGTTAFEPLARARAAGLEVIVVDHHAAEERLPEALAVVNPNRVDQESPLKHLAAVGVTFVVLVGVSRALRARGFFADRPEPPLLGWLDLVALGTVCDVVPLTGLNRAFVHQGLKVAHGSGVPGMAALARAAGLAAVTDARQLGFVLGPRINAGGRIGQSDLGARLLVSEDPVEVAEIAARLDALNAERQAVERALLDAAQRAVEAQAAAGLPVLVAAGQGWHHGIVGIVASRLVERFHRPVVVLGVADGVAKGSARSIRGFDLGAAVIAARQQGLLVHGGGHGMAAGMTLEEGGIRRFHDFLVERFAAERGPGVPEPEPLELDGALSVGAAQPALANQIGLIAPYGPGNAEPRFCLTDARVTNARVVGDGHVSCLLAGTAGGRVKGIAFRSAQTALGRMLLEGRITLRLAGRVKLDVWQGRERAAFEIEDAAAP
ncbi:single-stranded-DNA-specific exonuclease RecJ [Benzoatithermus flavus]|uniref:Single-stranded-DNA-specific exonuclease RecJ n=1 Tax=Benzoatithermus flavus TaxID=3108223 RepID=A0ABU8XQB8_9PROT